MSGAVYPDLADGYNAVNNISASTVLKSGSGRVVRVIVTTAGSTVGGIYDDKTVSSPANLIYSVPNTAGIYELKWPMVNGITYIVGTGQVVSISYS